MTSSKPMDTLPDEIYIYNHGQSTWYWTKGGIERNVLDITDFTKYTRSQQSQPAREVGLDQCCPSCSSKSGQCEKQNNLLPKDDGQTLATQADGQGMGVDMIKIDALKNVVVRPVYTNSHIIEDTVDWLFKTYNVTAKEGKDG